MNSIVAVEIEALQASIKVYEKHIKKSIREVNGCNQNVLSFLLNKPGYIITDNIFSWMASSSKRFTIDDICTILNKKFKTDNYITSFLKICSENRYEWLSLDDIDKLLETYSLERNNSCKILIINLISDFDLKLCSFSQYPVSNIKRNYENIQTCIDRFVCEAAYLANCNVLRDFIAALTLQNIDYKFQPNLSEGHQNTIEWLEKNITKGETNPQAELGWTMGPDSAPWPSTDLNDYKETILLLNGMTRY